MQKTLLSDWDKYIKQQRLHRRWRGAVALMCMVVLLLTSYALVLPAVTMEKECLIPEHIHEDGCYTQVVSATVAVPSCDLECHQHETACFGEQGENLCGYADFVVHHHDAHCYDAAGDFWCALPEMGTHTHSDGCFVVPASHFHEECCYTQQRGELTCEEHVHTDACWEEQTLYTCGKEESEGHTHTDSCRGLSEDRICGQEESDSHKHDDSCYGKTEELTCGKEAKEAHRHDENCRQVSRKQICNVESDHVHTDACYTVVKNRTCGQEETPADASVEPELICRKAEIMLHSHDESCFDENSSLICGKMLVLEHQHGDSCFTEEEIPIATTILSCTVPEGEGAHVHADDCYGENGELFCGQEENPGHQHGTRCYGTWELTCRQEVHTHAEDCFQKEPAAQETENRDETLKTQDKNVLMLSKGQSPTLTVTTDDPIDVEMYIQAATIEYRTDDTDGWIDVSQTGGNGVPGKAELRVNIQFDNVPIDALRASGGSMVYTMPQIFRDIGFEDGKTESTVQSGDKKIGSISVNVDANTVVIQIDASWLNQDGWQDNSVVTGTFNVQAKAAMSQITEGNTSVEFNEITVQIPFETDALAKSCDLTIDKNRLAFVPQSTDNPESYLEYELIVTAGADPCPGVLVEDVFTVGQNFIKQINGIPDIQVIEPADANVTFTPYGDNYKMVWNIGNMSAGSVMKLRYKVILKDGYTGVTAHITTWSDNKKNNKEAAQRDIQNQATAYTMVDTQKYERGQDSETFTPKAGGTLIKSSDAPVLNADGSVTINYHIWVQAYDTNEYTLEKVTIRDVLDGTGKVQTHKTDSAIREYLEYDMDSFKLYLSEADKTAGNGIKVADTEYADNLDWTADTNSDGKYNDGFTYNLGNLAPGEKKYLDYEIRVSPDAFVDKQNTVFDIKNRLDVWTYDALNYNEPSWLNGYVHSRALQKRWVRKTADSVPTAQEITVSMEADSSFTVPAGSFQYQVIVNEAGIWNLSGVTMQDTLGEYLQFVGYVKVEAFEIGQEKPAPDQTDAQIRDYFDAQTADSVKWVSVDGGNTFTIDTDQLFGSTKNYAYRLTYYAKPVRTDEFVNAWVGNNFAIIGPVLAGSNQFENFHVDVSNSILVSGNNSFRGEKHAWYYDKESEKLYWAIKVDGHVIPENTVLKDTTNEQNYGTHTIAEDALVGVYTGNLGSGGIAAYSDIAHLISSPELKPVESTAYTARVESANSLIVTLNQDVTLETGESLYLIVRTDPVLPSGIRDGYVYKNKLSKQVGDTWPLLDEATQTIYNNPLIFKETAEKFRYDGTNRTDFTLEQGERQKDSQILTQLLRKPHPTESGQTVAVPGTYMTWLIHVNYDGSLKGNYRILEQIPEGMELGYIRLYWCGPKYTTLPQVVPITGLGPEWNHGLITVNDKDGRSFDNHYYCNGNQVMMELSGLVDGRVRDDYALEIQVVCRVVDPDVLLGRQTKSFVNCVQLLNQENTVLATYESATKINASTIAKDVLAGENQTIPFEISVNPLGEDLNPDSDTITLVDEMGAHLILDPSSIKVSHGSAVLSTDQWNCSVKNNSMTFELPDEKSLTITYNATITGVKLGDTIDITNSAYWQGYKTTGTVTGTKSYTYSVNAVFDSAFKPKITVEKANQENINLPLAGAEFTLTQMHLSQDDTLEPVNNTAVTATTDENGTLIFGTTETQVLLFNTIYRVQETKAPEGYVLDGKPFYILFAKKVDDELVDGTVDADNFNETLNQMIHVVRSSTEYTHHMTNHRGEITVTKQFAKADGTIIAPFNGRYRFGLFAMEEGTLVRKKDVSLTWPNENMSQSVKFTDVPFGTYHVYELDDQDQPIVPAFDENGQGSTSGTVSGIPFVVHYTQNASAAVNAESWAQSVTVTNQMNYGELPYTGGVGTLHYTVMGVLMCLAALWLLYDRNKGRKGKEVSF